MYNVREMYDCYQIIHNTTTFCTDVKFQTTKFWLQDILGKTLIPGTTIALLVLYMFVVIIQC